MRERLVRERLFFFILLIILIILATILVWPFLGSILLAIAVVVIMKPVHNGFLKSRLAKGNESRAAVLTIFTFILAIAVPVLGIVGLAITQAAALFTGLEMDSFEQTFLSGYGSIEELIHQIGVQGIQMDLSQFADSIQALFTSLATWLGDALVTLGQSIPQFFTSAMIVLVIMYVLLPRFNRPEQQDILEIVPFPREITQLFLDKFNMMIVGIFKGTFVIALIQGGAMGLVLLIAGVPYFILLTILSMFLALIPLIGISLVAWPVGIILILQGQVWQGIFVILAFVIIVANIDTVLRPRLVPKGAYLNPALIILSVFGGLKLMGIIGLFYGPVIMILLLTSLDVYTKYMLRSDLEVLAEQGRIDLKALGLAPDEEAKKESGSQFMNALKKMASRFQGKPEGKNNKTSDLDQVEESPPSAG